MFNQHRSTLGWLSAIVFSLVGFSPGGSHAQQEVDLLRAVNRTRLEAERVARLEELASLGLVSKQTLGEAQAGLVDARLQVIAAATKSSTVLGRVLKVRRVVMDPSGSSESVLRVELEHSKQGVEWIESLGIEGSSIGLGPGGSLHNVEVRVLASDTGEILTFPYSRTIEQIGPGTRAVASFEIIREARTVAIVINSAIGQTQQVVPVLKLGPSATLTTTNTALRGVFGETVAFPLELELGSARSASLELSVQSSHEPIDGQVVDLESDGVVQTIVLTEDVPSRRVELRVTLPDSPRTWLTSGETVEISVAATDESNQEPQDSLSLSLLVLGQAELALEPESLYYETRPGDELLINYEVRNRGSEQASGIYVLASTPQSWRATESELIETLAPRSEISRTVVVDIPPDTLEGDYTIGMDLQYEENPGQPSSYSERLRIRVVPAGVGQKYLVLLVLIAGIAVLGFLALRARRARF